ncbi:MAG TPA: GTP cyclohydrolase I FolE [Clostridiaceae bacterium]|nr:GTP cyclohydrolase I FolE [Clostridiaceae bacterium]
MMDMEKIERAMREILEAIGEDPDRDGLKDTPRRVANMYAEIFSGLNAEYDTDNDIRVFNVPGSDEMILVGDIPFYSMCEHHFIPFFGKAHIAYIPKGGRVIGLSKLARILEHQAKRPQVQERLTSEVADLIFEALKPYGVAVVIEAEHMCMTMRGVKKPGSVTVTSALRGILKTDAKSRSEAMSLIWRGRNA